MVPMISVDDWRPSEESHRRLRYLQRRSGRRAQPQLVSVDLLTQEAAQRRRDEVTFAAQVDLAGNGFATPRNKRTGARPTSGAARYSLDNFVGAAPVGGRIEEVVVNEIETPHFRPSRPVSPSMAQQRTPGVGGFTPGRFTPRQPRPMGVRERDAGGVGVDAAAVARKLEGSATAPAPPSYAARAAEAEAALSDWDTSDEAYAKLHGPLEKKERAQIDALPDGLGGRSKAAARSVVRSQMGAAMPASSHRGLDYSHYVNIEMARQCAESAVGLSRQRRNELRRAYPQLVADMTRAGPFM